MAGAQDTESTTRLSWEAALHRDATEKAGATVPPTMTVVPPGKEQPTTYDASKYWEDLAAAELKKKDEAAVAAGTPPSSPLTRTAGQNVLGRMKE